MKCLAAALTAIRPCSRLAKRFIIRCPNSYEGLKPE
jgi:hypothetical protein